jgi:glucose-6-phosphate 1-dehydrogenase
MASTTYSLQTGEDAHGGRVVDPCNFVIFRALRDLTKQKLIPALCHLEQADLLPANFVVVGAVGRDLSVSFPLDMRDGILRGGGVDEDDSNLEAFIHRVRYFAANFDDDLGVDALKSFFVNLDEEFGTRGSQGAIVLG